MRRDLVLTLALLVACRSRGDEAAPASGSGSAPAPRAVRTPNPAAAGSTIARADYIGPAACGECHPEQSAQWAGSLHAIMNQRAVRTAVVGDFGGTVVRYRGGEARFDGDAAAGYTMTLAKGETTVRYRVTRTIGVRHLQEYVGVELRADGEPGDEVRLPFGWWVRRGGWYAQPYFDPWLPEDKVDVFAPVREPWAERCPWCHSTYAFEQRIARASVRHVGHGFEQQFASVAPGGTDRLALDQQVTVGISCESCHLGGRAHAAGAPIHFVPQGAEPRPGAPVPTTFTQERADPVIVNTVCAQCHSGPSPRLADGTALRNSSEALDLAASPCTTARCVDCHDPHTGGSDERRAVAACTTCHPALADPAAARTHAGHEATSCLDCHMPKVVMGIDRFVRTHRISSPTDPRVLATAGPNACNLCHLDRSIAWTVAELRREFEVRLDPRGWNSYGDPEEAVGDVWLASPEPALRLIAAAAYARSPLGTRAVAQLVRGLADPLAHVRTWTVLALEDLLGRRITDAEFDPRAAPEERARQIARLRAGPLAR